MRLLKLLELKITMAPLTKGIALSRSRPLGLYTRIYDLGFTDAST